MLAKQMQRQRQTQTRFCDPVKCKSIHVNSNKVKYSRQRQKSPDVHLRVAHDNVGFVRLEPRHDVGERALEEDVKAVRHHQVRLALVGVDVLKVRFDEPRLQRPRVPSAGTLKADISVCCSREDF